jgi:hypothetical protein
MSSGRFIPLRLELNGHQYDNTEMTCLSGAGVERWSIDVPSVLWLLDRIAEGDVDASAARNLVHQATRWDSECCGACDRAAPYFGEAFSRHRAVVERWEQQERLDEANYPYVENGGTIHRRSCRVRQRWVLYGFQIIYMNSP